MQLQAHERRSKLLAVLTASIIAISAGACARFSAALPGSDNSADTAVSGTFADLTLSPLQILNSNGEYISLYLVDIDGDGIADGASFGDDGIGELIFITDANLTTVAFVCTSPENGRADYYLTLNGDGIVTISTGINGSGVTMYPVSGDASLNESTVTGLTSALGGETEDSIIGSILSDTNAPQLSVNPGNGSFDTATNIYSDCNDDWVCNYLRIDVANDGATDTYYFTGGQASVTLGDSNRGTFTVTVTAFDSAGNSTVVTRTYTFALPVLEVEGDFSPYLNEPGDSTTYTLRLSEQPSADVSVPLNIDTEYFTLSVSSVTLTPGNWDTGVSFDVTATEDDVDNDSLTVDLTIGSTSSDDVLFDGLTGQTISISKGDNDTAGFELSRQSLLVSESGASDTVEVRLLTRPEGDVNIEVTTASGTTYVTINGGSDNQTLTFNQNNWDTFQSITAVGQEDGGSTATVNETLNFTIGAGTTDATYSGSVADQNLPVVVADNDTVGAIFVSPAAATLQPGESVTVRVVLSSMPGVAVDVNIDDPDPTRFTVGATPLSFDSGNYDEPQSTTITAVDPSDYAEVGVPSTSFTFSTTTGDANYASSTAIMSANWTDDDFIGIYQSRTYIGLNEADGLSGDTATIYVNLTSRPTSSVTVNFDSFDSAVVLASGGPLTFTPSNWADPQPFFFQGADDITRDGIQSSTVTFTVTQSAVTGYEDTYSGYPMPDVNVDTDDNDFYIFETTDPYSGDLGGPSGADSICNNDPGRPDNSASYRALLVDGQDRNASNDGSTDNGQNNWVLYPHSTYLEGGGGLSFTTDQYALTSTLNAFGTGYVWTGFDDGTWQAAGDHCNGWTDGSSDVTGTFGDASASIISSFLQSPDDAFGYGAGYDACFTDRPIVCVEE